MKLYSKSSFYGKYYSFNYHDRRRGNSRRGSVASSTPIFDKLFTLLARRCKFTKSFVLFMFVIFLIFFVLSSFLYQSILSVQHLTSIYTNKTLGVISKNVKSIKIDLNVMNENYDLIFSNLIKSKETFAQLVSLWREEYLKYYLREPPTNYEKWVGLATDLKCYLHPKYYKQMNDDLSYFRDPNNPKAKSISKQMQEEAYKITSIHSYYTSVLSLNPNGSVIQNKTLLDWVWPLLFTKKVLSILPREVKIVTNIEESRILVPDEKCWNDNYSHETKLHSYLPQVFVRLPDYKRTFNRTWFRPLFSHSKLSACHRDILLPGVLFLGSFPVFTNTSWNEKLNKFTWRGSTTGGWHFPDGKSRRYHRMRFVEWAMQQRNKPAAEKLPVEIDVGFTSTVQCEPEACKQIRDSYLFLPNMTQYQQHLSKYIPVIDGNVFPARLRGFLHSNSLIFYSSIFTQWFSNWIKPFVHYVPFKLDFSDLEENILWAYSNDQQAREIGERAKKFAMEHLRYEDMGCYAGLVVLEYADLLE